jgi:hypothetical protein
VWRTPSHFCDYFAILGITYVLLATTMENTLSHIDGEREISQKKLLKQRFRSKFPSCYEMLFLS